MEIIKKTCNCCKNEKFADEFSSGRDSNGLDAYCKVCRSKKSKKRYRNMNPLERWINVTFADSKNRAKRKDIVFTIVKADLKTLYESQLGKCKYCDNDFSLKGTRKNHKKSPTIDQVIPKGGYTKDNIVLACHRCNTIKSDASLKELEKLVLALKELTTVYE